MKINSSTRRRNSYVPEKVNKYKGTKTKTKQMPKSKRSLTSLTNVTDDFKQENVKTNPRPPAKRKQTKGKYALHSLFLEREYLFAIVE